jgi:hypothetical protein
VENVRPALPQRYASGPAGTAAGHNSFCGYEPGYIAGFRNNDPAADRADLHAFWSGSFIAVDIVF